MKILYLGDDFTHSTSMHRALALRRLGHEVRIENPRRHIPATAFWARINVRTGFAFWRRVVARRLLRAVAGERFDVVWVNCGEVVSAGLLRALRRQSSQLINYNNDDPFGRRDLRKWRTYLEAVPEYDLVVVVREPNVREAFAAGARQVVRVFMSYDPVAHQPAISKAGAPEPCGAEVLFAGTWMPERGPLLTALLDRGVPVTIYGDLWQKAAEWPRLRACWQGPAVYGQEYVATIRSSKIVLGLLSKGNRDLHTQRSAEVPYISGAAFVAERTAEHAQMYRDGVEAALWTGAEECAERCLELLRDEARRQRMVAAASERVRTLRLANDEILQAILAGDCAHPFVSLRSRAAMAPTFATGQRPRVAAVIAVFNRLPLTQRCLAALRRSGALAEVVPIIVDDGSTDGTGEWLAQHAPEAVVVRGDGNWWFGRCTQAGIERALALHPPVDYVLTLNNDSFLDPEAVDRMIAVSQGEACVGIPLRMVDKDVVTSPGLVWHWWQGLIDPVFRNPLLLGPDPARWIPVELFATTATLIPAPALRRIRGIDWRRHPQHRADVDLFAQLRQLGVSMRLICRPLADHEFGPAAARGSVRQMTLGEFWAHSFGSPLSQGHLAGCLRSLWQCAPSAGAAGPVLLRRLLIFARQLLFSAVNTPWLLRRRRRADRNAGDGPAMAKTS